MTRESILRVQVGVARQRSGGKVIMEDGIAAVVVVAPPATTSSPGVQRRRIDRAKSFKKRGQSGECFPGLPAPPFHALGDDDAF